MERPNVDGHATIGGGAVIRLSKKACEEIQRTLTRADQTFISLGETGRELVEVLRSMGEPIEPEVEAHLGMTPDGGYKSPNEGKPGPY